MIIYSGSVKEFQHDVRNNCVAEKIRTSFIKNNIAHNNMSEYTSWVNSLRCMYFILDKDAIDEECKVAIEYRIPATSKRVDFIITGKDENDIANAIIIELKQWEKAERTDREDIVKTFVGKGFRSVTHPSYQAHGYSQLIKNYNELVHTEDIMLRPCALLHNYNIEYSDELTNTFYSEALALAPIFFSTDFQKLRDFIRKYIRKADNGEILYKIENGRIRPSKVLQDTLASMLKGNREFVMIDEQKVAFSTIKDIVQKALINNRKSTIIVQGGPGTGKSVLAINLLVDFKHLLVNYVTKNSAPREVYFEKLRQNNYKANYIKHLFKNSGIFFDVEPNSFDCLIVDESHRLGKKSGFYANQGENQVKEIINASKVSIFFIDEDQIVTTKDIGSINEIKKWAKKLNCDIYYGEDLKLSSQFRCNGSDGYIAFLDNALGIRDTANDVFDLDYELVIFDDPNEMRERLREKNTNNKARMLAGYCYEWISKSQVIPGVYDINLANGFKANWNLSNTQPWAIDPNSFEQVGCIHTSQGLEFDYVAVIIGKDLIFRDGKVLTDKSKIAKSDRTSGVRSTNNEKLADQIIRNTYKTLLSRGQKGCYIYCEDVELSTHLKSMMAKGKVD